VPEVNKVKPQDKHALLGEFKKRLREKNLDDSMNIYAEQHAADALIKSYTLKGCYELIEYYFNVSLTPSWTWFKNNADKINRAKKAKEEDKRVRAMLKQQARDWLRD
jgi:hypothetical protein